jgi:hypothetical protein
LHKKIHNSLIIEYDNSIFTPSITINDKQNNYIFFGLHYTNYPKYNYCNCYYLNLEQLSIDGSNSNYNFLKPIVDFKIGNNNIKILDYSYANTNILNKLIKTNYIPYQVNKEEIFDYEKTIDFVTCCSWNERIMTIYNNIKEKYDNSYSIGNPTLWGKERDDILFRSKVLVNIHHRYKDYFILEEIRIIRCILNKIIVVSEKSMDFEDFPLKKYMIFVDYDNLISKTDEILQNYNYYYNLLFNDYDINKIDNLLKNILFSSLNI